MEFAILLSQVKMKQLIISVNPTEISTTIGLQHYESITHLTMIEASLRVPLNPSNIVAIGYWEIKGTSRIDQPNFFEK